MYPEEEEYNLRFMQENAESSFLHDAELSLSSFDSDKFEIDYFNKQKVWEIDALSLDLFCSYQEGPGNISCEWASFPMARMI